MSGHGFACTVTAMERTMAMVAWREGQEAGVATGLGRALPPQGRFTEQDGLILARTAPSQLLALRQGEASLMTELAAVTPMAGLIDLSDSRVAARVRGPGARARLALLVPLDLDGPGFGPGTCAGTLMAHLTVLLLQHGPDDYELQCGRSFEGSFQRALAA